MASGAGKAADRYAAVGLLIARLGLGLGFLYFDGLSKLTGGPERWAEIGTAMTNFGIGFGHAFFGFMAGFAESIGGLMIAAGLLFRPFCVLLCIHMLVALVFSIGQGDLGSPGHAFRNLFVFAGLVLLGPGTYSLDARRTGHEPHRLRR